MSKANPETRVKLNNVRVTFPYLDEPAKYKETDLHAYYSMSVLLPKDHPDLPALAKAIRAAAVLKWKDQADEMLKVIKAKDKLPIHDGNLKASKPYGAAYVGMMYVSARNKEPAKPPLFDIHMDPATGKACEIKKRGKFYSGCYVNVYMDLFGYKQDRGEGIGASIAAVQFARDGERLAGGGTASADDFEAVPEQVQKAAEVSGGGAGDFFL